MNRKNLQDLARKRLREARCLLDTRHFDSAYFLSGFAIECALKACIARKTRRFDFPDKHLANRSWKHELNRLLETAGLDKALKSDVATRPVLASQWASVKDWDNQSRYTSVEAKEAQDLYKAARGVLSWLRRHW